MKGIVKRFLLPVMALSGLGYALYFTFVVSAREPPPPSQLALPAENPYPAAISGSGLIEANTRNIAIGTFEGGIVSKVAVAEGQEVGKGDILFVLDQRLAQADVAIAQQEVASAESRILEMEADLADRQDQLRRVEGLKKGISVTEDRLLRARFAERSARARLSAARVTVDVARARLQSAQVALDRLTVRAPISGRILKVNLRPGEFVAASASDTGLVLMGNDRPLHVRVQIDENDIWRLATDAPTEAVVRGTNDMRIPLTFVRVEPYVMPKQSLTGDRTERVDTRVLEIIYKFDPANLPVFIGQQVDVFIKVR